MLVTSKGSSARSILIDFGLACNLSEDPPQWLTRPCRHPCLCPAHAHAAVAVWYICVLAGFTSSDRVHPFS
eukprot:COSAG01_NODE_570_length_15328_cov_82.520783_11_plen_71_part_00